MYFFILQNMQNRGDLGKMLAERLKEARKNAGYNSASAAAEALGVKYPTYAAHENGTRIPKAIELALYAKRFHVSQAFLLDGRDGSLNQPAPHQRLQTSTLHIDPDILYDVILRLNQELVKQKKKMNASERSFAIALGYEEKHRKINGLPPLRPEEIAMLIKRPDREDDLIEDDNFSM
jgi:transcriptional regulator with XRE-family HTH domain